ncbi:MAG: helix-turn-helix transcriptional regulator [Candidatus Competibacter sp.]
MTIRIKSVKESAFLRRGVMSKPKTIHSTEYADFLRLLRQFRERQGLTQEQLAEKLGATQSFISKCERGERRIDALELRAFCLAMGVSMTAFVAELEQILSKDSP